MKLYLFKKIFLLSLIPGVVACSSQKNIDSLTDGDAMMNGGKIHVAQSGSSSIPGAYPGSIEQIQQDNAIYFDLNKYDILSNYADILDLHANFLRTNPTYKVTIEGHADERGTPEYNIALGERRANAVKMYLQGKGILEDQMKIVSYGKERPAVQGHDEQSYAKNRRAILIYAY